MCIIILFTFVSCSNNAPSETLSHNNKQTISEQASDTVSDNITETSTKPDKDTEKSIKNFYVNYGGFKMNVDFEERDISDMLEAEKNAIVPDVKMKTPLADLIAVYTDNTESTFGTVYVGEDNCCYLQFANSDTEGAAYKMPDSEFMNEVF